METNQMCPRPEHHTALRHGQTWHITDDRGTSMFIRTAFQIKADQFY